MIRAIRAWHPGKLLILWAWGAGLAAFLLVDFQRGDAAEALLRHLVDLCAGGAVLLALSALTWIWLGGRERGAESRSRPRAGPAAGGAEDA